ncbi:MAG: hypothetical protein HY393_04215 [Candidatus Diapherotrites archaeon]|nr:hypothetical protein [Candidatus Diapherotrites archaeon]
MKGRGQVSLVDALAAFFVFLLVFAGLMGITAQLNHSRYAQNVQADLEFYAVQGLARLTQTPGLPLSWDSNTMTVSTLGLAFKPGVLSMSKVNAFASMDYNTARTALGVNGYDFFFSLDGVQDYNVGLPLYATGQQASAQTSVSMNGGIGIARLYVYQVK